MALQLVAFWDNNRDGTLLGNALFPTVSVLYGPCFRKSTFLFR
jgi:hypothetical protein